LVELLIQLIHSDEILSVEVSILLILRAVHIYLVYFVYLPKKVLFIDAMAVLIKLREPLLYKTPHLEYTKHLFLLVLQREIVREKLYLI
jgi:hypothetical protein